MCKNCLISLIATFFLVYAILFALEATVNLWLYSLIITVLLSIAIIMCPVLNKDGLKCCIPPKKPVRKAKRRR